MKKRNKKPINYSRDRVVLSDTLPYEAPLIFSNRHFYNFLYRYKIRYIKDYKSNGVEFISHIEWDKQNKRYVKQKNIIEQIIRLLFDIKSVSSTDNIEIGEKEERKIPFTYRISHKVKSFRELSIPHPKNQVELVTFYEDFKELIIYYSKQSKFSIRKPFSIAKFVFVNDSLHKKIKGDEDDYLEESGKEYESLKTFFTYRKYPNIYKFYEDYRYHRAEKKYDKLLTFDISRCFDSIYTHSIAWALQNKDIVKDNLHLSKDTFADRFDIFMRNTNYGETNGILIGPEFSRIFAELILQQIDKTVERNLRPSVINNVHYEIYRYVDDYFVFYNEDKIKDEILQSFHIELGNYKMSISDSKTDYFEKPIITDLTIAKNRIVELFDESIKLSIEKLESKNDKFHESIRDFKTKCNSDNIITNYKAILNETDVKYSDILNYTFAILSKRIDRSIKVFEEYYIEVSKLKFQESLNNYDIQKIEKQEYNFILFIANFLDIVFFLYTVSPKVNITIKLSNILSSIILFTKGKYKLSETNHETLGKKKYFLLNRFKPDNTEYVLKKISDDISLVLRKYSLQELVQIETLYLLVIQRELGKKYRLTVNDIIKYFKLEEIKVEEDSINIKYKFPYKPNYFVITVLLFYIRNIKSFRPIKLALMESLREKIESVEKYKRTKYSELIIMLFDLIVCPYLDNNFKRELLRLFGLEKKYHENLLGFKIFQKYWFTKWDKFNLAKEIKAKKALETY